MLRMRWPHRTPVRLLAVWMVILCLACAASAAQDITVSGGINPNGFNTPGLFTWHSTVPIHGSGWAPGESVTVSIAGPINTLGVAPTNRVMKTVTADGGGNFDDSFVIPYDEGGPRTMPQPGYYEVRASAPSGSDASPAHINLCPATYLFDGVGIDWSHERGGRDGGVGGIKKVFPHWMSVWDEKPVGIYGECSFTDTDGNNIPSFMRHSEYPGDHYAHDFNIMLVPDEAYRWVLGTANYYNIEDKEPNREYGRLEIEHEMLNDGGISYGHGLIGMPLFVLPTPGDRIYTVGRWTLDAGHPDKGDRCEMHPPRLLVTLRKRPTVMPVSPDMPDCMTYATQADVYLSPHFGGAGRNFYSLSNVLGSGGRIQDVQSDTTDYYSGDIFSSTGLNTEPFASNGGYNRLPEAQTINDMDYDFDVPLPPAPSGATAPQVQVTHQQNHGTAVVEQITYTNPVNGLPTVAHVHIPAQGGDNGIYAATLKFAWDKYKAPAKHFQIRLQNMLIKDNSDDLPFAEGEWYMWADVAGHWINLTQVDSDAFLNTSDDDVIDLTSTGAIDVYVNPGDPLYTAAFGYEQDCLDGLFGTGFGWDSFDAAINLAACAADLDEPLDNDDLAGAVFKFDDPTKTNAPGNYDLSAAKAILNDDDSHYNLRLKVDYVPAEPRIEVNGVPASFGNVCLNASGDKVVEIYNIGEKDLEVNDIQVTGGGFSRLGSPNLPFTIAGGEHVNVTVRFSPTDINQGAGKITFFSTDHCQGKLTYDLDGTVSYPKATLSGNLAYGFVPVDDRTVGFSSSKTFKVNNTGGCPLVVSGATVSSGASSGFSLGTLPSFPQTIQPGGSLSIPVVFNPVASGAVSGSVDVTVANDPTASGPLTINMTGNGIVPTASSTPANTIFDPTVVGFTKSTTVTVFNTGPSELIIDNVSMAGAGFSVAPVSLPIRLAPNGSTTLNVTFAPPSVARRFNGTLTLTTNDPVHPVVTNTFCGEGVLTGIRLTVLKADGTPYATVDQIALASFGVHPNTSVTIKNAPLVSINPPTSCVPLRFQFEKALPSTDQNNKKGSYYNLKAKVGAKSQNKSFTLAPSDFLQITIKLQ